MRLSLRCRWLSWICLSLMIWAAVAESTHTHPNKTEAASCTICVVAHSSAPVANSHQAKPVFAAIGWLKVEDVSAQALLRVAEFGIRGPPAA